VGCAFGSKLLAWSGRYSWLLIWAKRRLGSSGFFELQDEADRQSHEHTTNKSNISFVMGYNRCSLVVSLFSFLLLPVLLDLHP